MLSPQQATLAVLLEQQLSSHHRLRIKHHVQLYHKDDAILLALLNHTGIVSALPLTVDKAEWLAQSLLELCSEIRHGKSKTCQHCGKHYDLRQPEHFHDPRSFYLDDWKSATTVARNVRRRCGADGSAP